MTNTPTTSPGSARLPGGAGQCCKRSATREPRAAKDRKSNGRKARFHPADASTPRVIPLRIGDVREDKPGEWSIAVEVLGFHFFDDRVRLLAGDWALGRHVTRASHRPLGAPARSW
jgi:hypothetical protein